MIFVLVNEKLRKQFKEKHESVTKEISTAIENTVFSLRSGSISVSNLKKLKNIRQFWECYENVRQVCIFGKSILCFYIL